MQTKEFLLIIVFIQWAKIYMHLFYIFFKVTFRAIISL